MPLEPNGFASLPALFDLLCLPRNPLHVADVDLGHDMKTKVLNHGQRR